MFCLECGFTHIYIMVKDSNGPESHVKLITRKPQVLWTLVLPHNFLTESGTGFGILTSLCLNQVFYLCPGCSFCQHDTNSDHLLRGNFSQESVSIRYT